MQSPRSRTRGLRVPPRPPTRRAVLLVALGLGLALTATGCEGGKNAALAPGADNISYLLTFESENASADAELVLRKRLRAAGARSYQVWRNSVTVNVRVSAIADTGALAKFLTDEVADSNGALADIAKQHPYSNRPTAIKAVAIRNEN